MPALAPGDYRRVLELVAEVLRYASPEFPDITVTGFLRDAFEAEFAGAGRVDFRGTASRPWADSPRPIPVEPGGFHKYAVGHPLARAYRRAGEPVPLRLSDVASGRAAPPAYGGTGMNRVLTIPLAIAPQHMCTIALLRAGPDFTARDLQLACQLQPVLSGLYALRDRMPGVPRAETGVRLSPREVTVLDLMADGLIAGAIARRLGISPRTVGKHIENIYRKLGTHDRTSAVLRGLDLGIMTRRSGAPPIPAASRLIGGRRERDVSQSRGMGAEDAALRAYYQQGMERDRLGDGRGSLEFTRTTEIVLRRLPAAPAAVADIGGGPGRYALWLASLGYQVEHRDLMPLHVEQLTADAAGSPGIHAAVGDARDLDLPGASVDAALLLGPLYHLVDRSERVRALRECARIVRPGGPVFAAAISRWAARVDGMLRERIYLKHPAARDVIDEVDRTGILPPLHEGGFTAFCHRPGELRDEMAEAGLEVTDLVSVEGPAFILADLDARMADPAERSVALEVARAIERVPELVGFGPHLLATGIRPLSARHRHPPVSDSSAVGAAGTRTTRLSCPADTARHRRAPSCPNEQGDDGPSWSL